MEAKKCPTVWLVGSSQGRPISEADRKMLEEHRKARQKRLERIRALKERRFR